MKAFLDTSVLVATFYTGHEHHEPSLDLFVRCDKSDACCAAHSLAEVYSALTGMPGKYRTGPDQAILFLGSIRERLGLITLSEQDYWKALESTSTQDIIGGGVYDALLAHCALKAGASTLYTWNVKHFQRIAGGLALRVATP